MSPTPSSMDARRELLTQLEWPLGEDNLLPRMHSNAKRQWKGRIMEICALFTKAERPTPSPTTHEVKVEAVVWRIENGAMAAKEWGENVQVIPAKLAAMYIHDELSGTEGV